MLNPAKMNPYIEYNKNSGDVNYLNPVTEDLSTMSCVANSRHTLQPWSQQQFIPGNW